MAELLRAGGEAGGRENKMGRGEKGLILGPKLGTGLGVGRGRGRRRTTKMKALKWEVGGKCGNWDSEWWEELVKR